MAIIQVLDNDTIDKIAAGEVVERPSSVVKELVENAIDAGARIISVEIKGGGLKLIRVTDNGSGIEADQVRNAFLPHATSKIHNADDLNHLYTLGFRGEALSSIAAVSRTEVTSRTENSLTGIHYCIEGGREECCEEVGAPQGTTFIVRDLFYNTLPRLKFMKSETTEGNLVADLMEHLAMSMPGISFQFISSGITRFSTSGRGDLREVIYRIFGREMSENVRRIDAEDKELNLHITGYIGLPSINRSNRAGEIFYINHRYVKSRLISKAVEEGYQEYLMQHKFPFCILDMTFDPLKIDVNVHPTKQEVRLSQEKPVYDSIVRMVNDCLTSAEMIDSCILGDEQEKNRDTSTEKAVSGQKTAEKMPEMFEQNRIRAGISQEILEKTELLSHDLKQHENLNEAAASPAVWDEKKPDSQNCDSEEDFFTEKEMRPEFTSGPDRTEDMLPDPVNTVGISPGIQISPEVASPAVQQKIVGYEQLDFMDNEQLLSPEARRQYRIIGQVFKTYWLIEYKDTLLLMDQHAAHEKVNFERFMARMRAKQEIPSQMVAPPVIMTLNNREMQIFHENEEHFIQTGFTIEDFGDHEVAIRAVPMDLYDNSPSELVGEIISDLGEMKKGQTPDSIRTRIATQACKASVKGNNFMSVREVEELLDEMLTLDNPYNCPHGRPTVITITKSEMEKKFHRIV